MIIDVNKAPFCVKKDAKIRFLLEIDGYAIEVSQTLMEFLAGNKNGCLNHFLAGYFKAYPEYESEV